MKDNTKLYSIVWGAVVGFSALTLNAFAEDVDREYVAGSRILTNLDITLGGAVNCTLIADPVTGNVDDTQIPFSIEPKCSLNGDDYPVAVGFSNAENASFEDKGGMVSFTQDGRSVNIKWDNAMTVKEQGSVEHDADLFVGSYVVLDPAKATEVTGTIVPSGETFEAGAYSIPLVGSLYTN